MDLSRRWLSDYVDMSGISDKEFADKITLSGSKVESWGTESENLKNIVVGKVLWIGTRIPTICGCARRT